MNKKDKLFQLRSVINGWFPNKITTTKGNFYKTIRFSNEGYKPQLLSDFRDMVNLRKSQILMFNGHIPEEYKLPFAKRYGIHLFLEKPMIRSVSVYGSLPFQANSKMHISYIHEDVLVWANAIDHRTYRLIKSFTQIEQYKGHSYVKRNDVYSNSLIFNKFSITELIDRIRELEQYEHNVNDLEAIYEYVLLEDQIQHLVLPNKKIRVLNQYSNWLQNCYLFFASSN